jgi:hypothetical protein
MEHQNGKNLSPITPVTEYKLNYGESLPLTWHNTIICIFNNPTFNHIQYKVESGELVKLYANQDLIDSLYEQDYPIFSLPYVDQATFDWFVASESKRIEYDATHYTQT